MKHTKGPWQFDPHAENIIATDKTTDNVICRIPYTLYDPRTEYPELQHANAALIASAPDMLETLEYIYNECFDLEQKDWDLIETTIKKAKGTNNE